MGVDESRETSEKTVGEIQMRDDVDSDWRGSSAGMGKSVGTVVSGRTIGSSVVCI